MQIMLNIHSQSTVADLNITESLNKPKLIVPVLDIHKNTHLQCMHDHHMKDHQGGLLTLATHNNTRNDLKNLQF